MSPANFEGMIVLVCVVSYILLSFVMSPLLVRYAYWIEFVDSSRCNQRRWADRGEVLLTFFMCAFLWPIGFVLLTLVMGVIKLYLKYDDKFNVVIDFLADLMWGKCKDE